MTRMQRAWQAWLDLPIIGRMAVVLAALGLLWWPVHALAQDTAVARSGRNVLRLYLTPCQEPTRSLIKEEWRDKFLRASAIVEGHLYEACWLAKDDGTVAVVFEDGDTAVVSQAAFKLDPGI